MSESDQVAAANGDWELLQGLDELIMEELEAQIAAEEAAIWASAAAAEGNIGSEHPSTRLHAPPKEKEVEEMQAAVAKLEREKAELESKNAKLIDALATGNVEEMVKFDSRSSARASIEAALAAARKRNAAKDAHLDIRASDLAKEVDSCRRRLDFKQRGIDVCVMMDCTYSMRNHIEACKAKALEILELAPKLHSDAVTRLAFVGYRDFPPESGDGHFVIHDFVEKDRIGELYTRLRSVQACGGGNCEDVAGGLKKVTELSWSSSTRLVVHFADMPCHGCKYHSISDSHPSGNPDGLVPEDLLKTLCANRIDYHFAKINSNTDTMIEIFKGVYAQAPGAATFEVHEYGSSADNFIPVVLQSISSSMRRSYARSGASSMSSDGGYGKIALPEVYGLF